MSFCPLGPPIYTDINNGILYTMKSMPQKDITTDGESTFSMYRDQYMRTVKTSYELNKPNIKLQKKWYGGSQCRDASQITENNRTNSIGNGSLNANGGPISFLTKTDSNTQRDALRRVRNAGCAAPAKKIHKYNTAPVFY